MNYRLLISGIGSMVVAVWGPVAVAQLQPPQQVSAPGPASELETRSVVAELAGNHDQALSFAEKAIKADPSDAWGYYDRGDALASLGQTANAVAAFAEAERRFSQSDLWGKSIAVWGQADAFNRVGRFSEAGPIYERYAALVQSVDAEAADLGRRFAKNCVARQGAK